jgi:outer membrane protein OmpA-like peptidoglycan-associated protein/tetratricopeptide (TPR) repeat protein
MKNIIYSLLLSFAFGAFAQNTKINSGNKQSQKLAYIDAIKTYEKIVKKGFVNAEICKKIADAYYYNANYKVASEWYQKALELANDFNPEYYYRYAISLKSSNQIEESEKYMAKYVSVVPEHNRAQILKKEKNYKENIKLNSDRFEINTLSINSPNSDFGGSLYKDQLVFSSSRESKNIYKRTHTWTGLPFTTLFSGIISSEGLVAEPKKFAKSLDSKYNESTPVFTKDGKTVYFTRNNFLKGKTGQNIEGSVLLKIYRAYLNEKQEWDKIIELPFNSDNFQVAHPALSPDEKTLYFASDRPGSIGNSDIYKVEIKSDGNFGEPENLGKTINTEGRETFPFISESGILYFASDGRPGLGGLDIFQVDLNKINKRNSVLNIGAPINGTMDDFSFCINEATNRGFFTSNRDGGQGNDDVYGFIQNKPIVYPCEQQLAGIVLDKQTNEILPGSDVSLFSKDHQLISNQISNQKGEFNFGYVDCGSGFYIRASKTDYSTDEKEIQIPNYSGETKTTLYIEKTDIPIGPGTDLSKVFHIKEIYFDLDKYNIRTDATIELAKILEVLLEYPTMKIAINSHTDSRQTNSYNDVLSNNRAKSTRKWLIKQGIAADRLTAKGYGETKLVNNCSDGVECTEEQHQANRRSEFIVISL